jgi:hypothetical protein
MFAKGGKLDYLVELKKGGKAKRKCKCGCNMIAVKEKGGTMEKCACGCKVKSHQQGGQFPRGAQNVYDRVTQPDGSTVENISKIRGQFTSPMYSRMISPDKSDTTYYKTGQILPMGVNPSDTYQQAFDKLIQNKHTVGMGENVGILDRLRFPTRRYHANYNQPIPREALSNIPTGQ